MAKKLPTALAVIASTENCGKRKDHQRNSDYTVTAGERLAKRIIEVDNERINEPETQAVWPDSDE